jgi:(1->4)-alpha-D-glucan 1-alpha-D-glucosylmutase
VPTAVPLSTYRLQLGKEFGFEEAAGIVPYLKDLGITHLYVSPILKARSGSTHGYDVTDFGALNPELGGDHGFAQLQATLKKFDVGLILDFVPNHTAADAGNAWWFDVLEWGPRSPHAASFDISWQLLPYRPSGGVLLPVLGRPYGEALANGEIELKYDASRGSFSAWYFDHRFPINPQRYSDILRTIVDTAKASECPAGRELLAIAGEYLRPNTPTYAQAPALKQKLANIEIEDADSVIERGLSAYRRDHDGGVNLLHRLLERQHYRLADWRLAVSGINYRRFFDINELVGLRVEDARTFRSMHELVARLIATNELQGLRLDHIDGLLDPAQYTRRLGRLVRRMRGESHRQAFYTVVEKIVADGEPMPALPDIAGTTGYEWLNIMSRVLVDEAGRRKLIELWRNVDPPRADFSQVIERSKIFVLDTLMASEFAVLAQLLSRIAAGHYTTRDYSPDRLRQALRLYVLEVSVYRTYVTAQETGDDDRHVIERAIGRARDRWQGTDASIFNFLRDVLTLDVIRGNQPYSRSRVREFALKIQQFTGPMMAKSLEDTAFYRYHALLAMNEVGGDPTLPGLSISEFHDRVKRRTDHGFTATATHDTKRGEDARARILALSQVPEQWSSAVQSWRSMNASLVKNGSQRVPSHGHEYMLYQALIGAWPLGDAGAEFTGRFERYAIKAAREGKQETSWLNPNLEYEQGLLDFVRGLLDPQRSELFLRSFHEFARRTALLGALTGLAQLVLKATIPGVPDFYQGTEFWDLSLVDPDNRRPVDFSPRRTQLENLDAVSWRDLAERWPDGRIKLALTRRLLALRNEYPPLFYEGSYEPVEVLGPDRERVIAFTRSHARFRLLVAAARHSSHVTDAGSHWPCGWQASLDIDLSGFSDVLGCYRGQKGSDISELFAVLPVTVAMQHRGRH